MKKQEHKQEHKQEKDFMDLDVNKKNLQEFEELMEKSSYKYDSFFNSNSPLVRLILLSLFVFIIFGVVYYVVNFIFHL